MRKPLLLTVSLLLSSASGADDSGQIATLCKEKWPGDRGIQSFCIRENRNYRDWLHYTRKRVFSHRTARRKIDNCVSTRKPDYRKAFDCYWK